MWPISCNGYRQWRIPLADVERKDLCPVLGIYDSDLRQRRCLLALDPQRPGRSAHSIQSPGACDQCPDPVFRMPRVLLQRRPFRTAGCRHLYGLSFRCTDQEPRRSQAARGIPTRQPAGFPKLFYLPPHVYYSHRRHVVLGKLECVRCHGGIADTISPPTRPLVQISMDFCTGCHNQSKVTNDCKSCHR
jgi:hypothetical protein